MIDTQAMRSKILDLAMRGQLTDQLPGDGTAHELYRQIQIEKQEMIKTGTIKKEKSFPGIVKLPFDIPPEWLWVRWGDLSFRIQYGYNAPAKEKGHIRMVRITDIQDNSVAWDNVPFCDIDDDSIDEYLIKPNNILFARTGGTVGKSYLVEKVEEDAVFAGYLIRTSFSEKLSAKYMKYFMEGQLYWKQLQDGTTATAQPNCNAQTLSKMLVPLPPFAEQQRIVERIEQAFSALDTIDALQAKYADNLTVLKSKLIDAAIQGKLTEQLPEDGTAEELYQQIQEEKRGLIRAGKIKKETPLPEIAEDEVPFDIPETWKWVRFAEICSIINGDRGKNYPAKSTLKHEGIPFISALNLNGVSVTKDEHLLCLDDRQYELLGNGKLQKDDVVICIRGSLGKHGRYPFDKGAIASSLVISRLFYSQDIMGDYEMIWLDSSAFPAEIKRYDSGTAQPNLAANSLEKFLIPLPPLAEQKRIVEKLHEVLSLLQSLK